VQTGSARFKRRNLRPNVLPGHQHVHQVSSGRSNAYVTAQAFSSSVREPGPLADDPVPQERRVQVIYLQQHSAASTAWHSRDTARSHAQHAWLQQ
jgi:hypothetical protein